ncbi:MAG TPA: cation/H(+) antiporter, partial [Microbacterium sp.]|nr:cation/H(+) antiporter [Microbacterium sp.]
SVFLGGRDPGVASIVLAAFLVIAGLAIWLAFRIPHGMMHRVVSATLHTSGQYAIRVVFLILGALLALSIALDLDILLGAFTAGIVWQLMMRDASEENREAVESKIEGIAFGFLVPIFFIYTGVTFDLAALLANPALLLFVPVVLVALLIVRGVPSMLVAPPGSRVRDRIALGLLGATGLPIIVAVTAIGVDENLLTSAQAALFVTAGMLSVLIYPLIGMLLRGERVSRVPAELDDAV